MEVNDPPPPPSVPNVTVTVMVSGRAVEHQLRALQRGTVYTVKALSQKNSFQSQAVSTTFTTASSESVIYPIMLLLDHSGLHNDMIVLCIKNEWNQCYDSTILRIVVVLYYFITLGFC